MSPEQIRAFQQRQLKKIVKFAKLHSPFYSNLYKHIDPDDPQFELEHLPVTTKQMLMENFDRVVTDRRLNLELVKEWVSDPDRVGKLLLGKFVATTTSGTTGAPGYFVYNKRDWDWIQAFAVTRGIRFKPSFFQFWYYAGRIFVKRVKVALVSVLSGHFITYVLFKLTPAIGKLVSRFEYFSVVDPVDKLVAGLNELQPNVLHCYPTMLEVLAHEQMDGRLNIDPWIITCSSEPLTGPAREAIRKAFPHSPLFETYGTSEGVNLASECAEHDGLHLNNDYFIVEPVREDTTAVQAGEPGEGMLLSCLFSKAMPILRYEISDRVSFEKDGCDCGLPYPLIRVEGRTDDTLWVTNARGEPVALPPIPFEALFLGLEDLVQYRLVQKKRNLLLVLYRLSDSGDFKQVENSLDERFKDYLSRKGVGDSVVVQFEKVDEIRRDDKTGKTRQIVSELPRPFLPGKALGDRRSGKDRRVLEKAAETDRRQSKRRSADKQENGDS